ncbi:hypothetical protein CHLNCDRAFT_134637 [Chlorella variabilis]|uniref:Alpha-ketoglutarate-dependent dioxygenase AlkB-like domain-containing protein n=1 Tax=Chlorella variabilis TaxID=554065 RepID=E1ZGE7_CHLVA|nr:hypothetical protein CHLNCDRAFT_134637 [Chlorella variabilis]EFN54744.1 hypothetical protein CHLNCDRAFT_134637 [Chlorella variabilis]|eukprot:XP_005846846.1 hypothetical protein CHLNCDRAFT_134637 [Chlorella variabilis]
MEWWFTRPDNGKAQEGRPLEQHAVMSSTTSCHYVMQTDANPSAASSTGHAELLETTGAGSSLDGALAAFPALQQAGEMAAAAVSARIMSGGAAGLPLEAADRRGWAPSFAVVNCYAHGGAGLGAHSDRLTALGPAPIITSLTLGATRCFRLHRTCLYQLHSGSGGGGSASAQEAGASDIVPKTSKPIHPHKISGVARFNITFRRLKPQWQQQAPLCRCGRPSVMKAHSARQPIAQLGKQVPSQVLRYYYTCDNSQGPKCAFFKQSPHQVAL